MKPQIAARTIRQDFTSNRGTFKQVVSSSPSRPLEHLELWMAYKADPGNAEHRNAIFLSYTKWVAKIVNGLIRGRDGIVDDFDEMFSNGGMGLMRAIEKFDVDRGVSFLGYSRRWIVSFIYAGFECNSVEYARYCKLLKRRSRLNHVAGRKLNDYEFAASAGITEEKLQHIISAGIRHKLSSMEDFPGRTETLRISAPDRSVELKDSVDAVLKLVPTQFQKYVWLKCGEEISMQEMADQEGCSHQNISRKVNKGLAVAREKLDEQQIRLFGFCIPSHVMGDAA